MAVNDIELFLKEREDNIDKLAGDTHLKETSKSWFLQAFGNKYCYNFDWLGLPIIQFPQDILAVQEIIWKTKPDLIIETGVARGGSLILSASILHLLNGNGRVVGVDVDIREHNRQAIESHPLSSRISLIQGSSVDPQTIESVKTHIKEDAKVMVILDSNHTYEHVLKELELYSGFVTKNCYLIVMDTVVDEMPDGYFTDRPWGKNNNPKTAVHEFLKKNDRFEIDETVHNKLVITVANDGYLRCVK